MYVLETAMFNSTPSEKKMQDVRHVYIHILTANIFDHHIQIVLKINQLYMISIFIPQEKLNICMSFSLKKIIYLTIPHVWQYDMTVCMTWQLMDDFLLLFMSH